MLDFLATNSTARIALLAFLFAATVFVVFWITRLVSSRVETRATIRQIAGGNLGPGDGPSLREQRSSAWIDLAEKIESSGLSLSDTKDDILRQRLIAAGYTSPAAPKIFTLVRLVLIFVLPLLYWIASRSTAEPKTFASMAFYCLTFAALGLYLPNLFVRAKADRRREEITNGFPDCLDLMLVCVEAGLGLEAAMDRVGREMVNSHPLVANILSKVTLELRAGARRDEALRRMGETAGVAEIRSFATLLIQSDKLGTSIADTLRIYAAEMREKRRLRAEERAHRLPVLISIPLVLCMLPVMVGVLMIPGMVRVIRELMPVMGG